MTMKLAKSIVSACGEMAKIGGPRNSFNANKKHVPIRSSLPHLTADDTVYDTILHSNDWGRQLMAAVTRYDVEQMTKHRYTRLSAKEIVIAYLRCPESKRSSLVNALISGNVIVGSMNPISFPKEWKVNSTNLSPVKSLSRPIVAVQSLPFHPNYVYLFVDASFIETVTETGEKTGVASVGYVIIHNGTIGDEGYHKVARSIPSSNAAELEALNFGLKSLYGYLSSIDRADVEGVVICGDSAPALGQTRGTLAFHHLDPVSVDILWNKES